MFLNNRLIALRRTMAVMCGALLLLLITTSGIIHKFYLSKTIIEFNARSQQFEITCKMFTDDLEHTLTQSSGKPVKLVAGDESADADALIEGYMKQHFKCSIDGVPMEWRWVGKEVENDLTFCYLELYRKPDFTTFTLTNDMLMAFFPDQQNIVDLSIMGNTQTLVFVRDRIQQTFNR